MADIEKTLRHEARYLSIAESCGDECGVEYGKMCLDAAGEIERLRKALERLGSMEGFTGSFAVRSNNEGTELKARVDFARAALDQDKRGGGE